MELELPFTVPELLPLVSFMLPFPVVPLLTLLFVKSSAPSTTSSTTLVIASPASFKMESLPLLPFAVLPLVTLFTLELFPAVPDPLTLLLLLPDPDWVLFSAMLPLLLLLPLLLVVSSLLHATAKHIKPSARPKVRSFRVPAKKFDFPIFFIASSILLCELKIKTITSARNG